MPEITTLIDGIRDEIVDLRHEIHRHPELGYEEHGTAERVLAQLDRIEGLDIRSGVAETGIVATLGSDKPGPCVAFRADMDALPIEETGDVPYKSTVAGKMHACGHDGHTSCLAGAARVLSQMADELEGPVKFIFQPAEEGGAGGKRMCEEGALEDPAVDAIFGIHGWPQLSLGEVGVRAGALLAASDPFDIRIEGVGAHAAFPHLGVDPIVVASQVISAAQSIVSRTTDPLQAAVVTFGQVDAGTTYNIIPRSAAIKGTIRSLDEDVRRTAHRKLEEIATGVADGMGARAIVDVRDGYPVTYNDESATAYVERVIGGALGQALEQVPILPVMGGEDFAYYAEKVPASFVALGVRPKDRETYPNLHQSDYDFHDDAVPLGIRYHVEIARSFASMWKT